MTARRGSNVVTLAALLTPCVAFAATEAAGDTVSVSSLVIAGGSAIVSVLLALLAWSLKNNVEGFKIAMQQALSEAKRAQERADTVASDVARIRVEMAQAITREDLRTLTASVEQVRRDVATLTTQVAVLHHAQKEAT